jgi:hypothetical protein
MIPPHYQHQNMKEVFERLEARGIIVIRGGLVFPGTSWHDWKIPSNLLPPPVPINSTFQNAELYHIAIFSRRRSAYDLLRARGKNKEGDPQTVSNIHPPGVFFGHLIFDPSSDVVGRRGPLSLAGPIIVNLLTTELIETGPEPVVQKMKKDSNNILGKVGSKAQTHSTPVANPAKIRDNEAVNISKPRNRKAQAGTYKENETETISKVIALEYELGRVPGLNDLRDTFNRSEIDAAWDSLVWLYPGLEDEHAEMVMA